MTNESHENEALSQRIETIEKAYEFMLAYAAQGRERDEGGQPGSGIREFLESADAALDELSALLRESVTGQVAEPERHRPFLEITGRDAQKARAAIQLVLAQPSISSQLVDNLNASIHLRALLTDLFLIDEALKARGSE